MRNNKRLNKPVIKGHPINEFETVKRETIFRSFCDCGPSKILRMVRCREWEQGEIHAIVASDILTVSC